MREAAIFPNIRKESLFAQVVKNWYEGNIADEDHYAYDHARRVAKLQDVFGVENLTPALYAGTGCWTPGSMTTSS